MIFISFLVEITTTQTHPIIIKIAEDAVMHGGFIFIFSHSWCFWWCLYRKSLSAYMVNGEWWMVIVDAKGVTIAFGLANQNINNENRTLQLSRTQRFFFNSKNEKKYKWIQPLRTNYHHNKQQLNLFQRNIESINRRCDNQIEYEYYFSEQPKPKIRNHSNNKCFEICREPIKWAFVHFFHFHVKSVDVVSRGNGIFRLFFFFFRFCWFSPPNHPCVWVS